MYLYDRCWAGKHIVLPVVILYYDENDVPKHEIWNACDAVLLPGILYFTANPVVTGELNMKACCFAWRDEFLKKVEELIIKGRFAVNKLRLYVKYKALIECGYTSK